MIDHHKTWAVMNEWWVGIIGGVNGIGVDDGGREIGKNNKWLRAGRTRVSGIMVEDEQGG